MAGEDSEGGGEGKDKGKGEDTQLCWLEVVCVFWLPAGIFFEVLPRQLQKSVLYTNCFRSSCVCA